MRKPHGIRSTSVTLPRIPTSQMDKRQRSGGAINSSKNAVFEKHSRKYGDLSLQRMLSLLGKDAASTEWFGGYEQAGKWNKNPR